MVQSRSPARGRLTVAILLFVLLGSPLLAFLWETLNELMNGSVNPTRLLVSIPVLALFAALLTWLSRSVGRWTGVSSRPSTAKGAHDAAE